MRKISNIFKIMAFALLLVLILGVHSYAVTFRTLEYKAMLGDLDGDNRITFEDNRLMSRYLSGLEKFDLRAQIRADIDNNGRIDYTDAILLSNRILGTRTIKYVPGDLDSNNTLDSSDARLLERYLCGQEKFTLKQQMTADVNGDNQVDSADLRLITKKFVNMINAFPIEGDINGDGRINIIDTILALRASVGMTRLDSTMQRCADVDYDRKITSSDARIISRRSQGLE